MTKFRALTTAFAAAVMLAGCGGGGSSGPTTGPRLLSVIPVPTWGTATNASFDLGAVDSANSRYVFTDRNNKSVDVINTSNDTFVTTVTGGFAGAGASPDKSGPDGIDYITGTNKIYTGDVDSVKVIDKTTNTVTKTITINDPTTKGAIGLRADEGCFDPDHNIYMVSSPGASPPFATYISTTTDQVIGQVSFVDSAGLEACFYDHATTSFYVNNDGGAVVGASTNLHGEVDVIDVVASGLSAGTSTVPKLISYDSTKAAPAGVKAFLIPVADVCDPTGIVAGPGTNMAINCRPGTVGAPLQMVIMNRTNGAVVADINAGGGDQLWYDPTSNAYYNAASRWTSTGKSPGSCATATPCTPMLIIVSAATNTVTTKLAAGNNAHSVAVDPVANKVYMPFSSPGAPGGCSTCSDTQNFLSAGVAVYATK